MLQDIHGVFLQLLVLLKLTGLVSKKCIMVGKLEAVEIGFLRRMEKEHTEDHSRKPSGKDMKCMGI